MRRRAVGFFFDVEDFLLALEVAAERCAELAGVVLEGGFFAAGAFFVAAEGEGFAVFFAAGVEAPAAEDCASRALPVSIRQVETTATQTRDFLNNIASRSNHWLRSGPRRTRVARTRRPQRPQINCKLRSAFVARDAEKGTS